MLEMLHHTRAKILAPPSVWLRCRSRHTAFPFLNDTLSQLVHILDFPAVNPLLKNAPYLVIDRVEVWTIWKPQWRRDEVLCIAWSWANRPSPVRGEQVPNLVGSWSRRILWYRAEVFAWGSTDHTNYTHRWNERKISVLQSLRVRMNCNELLNVDRQRNKQLRSMPSFAKNI